MSTIVSIPTSVPPLPNTSLTVTLITGQAVIGIRRSAQAGERANKILANRIRWTRVFQAFIII